MSIDDTVREEQQNILDEIHGAEENFSSLGKNATLSGTVATIFSTGYYLTDEASFLILGACPAALFLGSLIGMYTNYRKLDKLDNELEEIDKALYE